jgi:acetyltransferase-like isoleucine patch superfamily enzyme
MTSIFRKIRIVWWHIAGHLLLRIKGVAVGAKCRFYGIPIIERFPGSEIELGDRVVLCSDSRYTALGVNHPVILRTLSSEARLTIGNDTGISGGSVCAAQKVSIGAEVLMGANVTVFDTDFHAKSPAGRRHNTDPEQINTRPVTLEDNVFIGTGAMICKGVRIGRNSIVGAGSVVIRDVETNCIFAGNPARKVSEL